MIYFKDKYPEYEIDYGLLNWSVYDSSILLNDILNYIKRFEEQEVKVEHMKDFLDNTNFIWKREDFYDFMKKLGHMLETDEFK